MSLALRAFPSAASRPFEGELSTLPAAVARSPLSGARPPPVPLRRKEEPLRGGPPPPPPPLTMKVWGRTVPSSHHAPLLLLAAAAAAAGSADWGPLLSWDGSSEARSVSDPLMRSRAPDVMSGRSQSSTCAEQRNREGNS